MAILGVGAISYERSTPVFGAWVRVWGMGFGWWGVCLADLGDVVLVFAGPTAPRVPFPCSRQLFRVVERVRAAVASTRSENTL